MRRFLVDTNVIVDVLSADPTWGAWSTRTLQRCADEGPVGINPIVYAELAAGFERIEDLEALLPAPDWERWPLPWPAGFLAGRSFSAYRARGGSRPRPLPDFYIGAHASVDGLTLITRDARRYRTYFPRLDLVAPA